VGGTCASQNAYVVTRVLISLVAGKRWNSIPACKGGLKKWQISDTVVGHAFNSAKESTADAMCSNI
jgi:hypothetical protein